MHFYGASSFESCEMSLYKNQRKDNTSAQFPISNKKKTDEHCFLHPRNFFPSNIVNGDGVFYEAKRELSHQSICPKVYLGVLKMTADYSLKNPPHTQPNIKKSP